jgi:hypothetical protein
MSNLSLGGHARQITAEDSLALEAREGKLEMIEPMV